MMSISYAEAVQLNTTLCLKKVPTFILLRL